ncbi:MAG: phenylalanine--tRNA ligase subunit beta [Candidatus Saccharimonadales bacterium]
MVKIVSEWLNQHLSEPLGVAEMVAALERAGIEVEEVIQPPEFDSRIVTATVVEVKPHPNADRLQVATVKSGSKKYQVVCGAPNLYVGQRVVFAQLGAVLPDGTEITQAKIRGHDSYGMLCSELELGLGGSHEGLLDLGTEVAADLPLREVFNAEQSVVDIKTAANRWDLQSYVGLAREVAAHTPATDLIEQIVQAPPAGQRVTNLFTNQAKEEVSCYGLLKLKLPQKVAASPPWMQRRLRLAGVRPINVVVDVTNYVMLETGQPLHAFDAAQVKGPLTLRFATNGEVLTTLDGVKRALASEDIVVASGKHPVALAGIMGGETAEIGDNTQEILVEAATFSDVLVRKSAKRHGLRTEASARFERGLPVQAVRPALRYAVHLLQEYAGAELTAYQNELNIWPWVQHIGVRSPRLQQLLGVKLEREEVSDYLRHLQIDAEPFDIALEARKHLAKPYKLGASFKTDGVKAFDCSYLVDYIYSLIGIKIGHTAHAQYTSGTAVELADLRPGDLVFRGGPWVQLDEVEREGVSHVALYIGEGKIIDARNNVRNQADEWEELPVEEQQVVELSLEQMSQDSQFLGARRYVGDLEQYVQVTAPWWRPDLRDEADIAEEVIKLYGLDNLEATLPAWRPKEKGLVDHYWSRLNELRQLLRGRGLFEVTTYPFISEVDLANYKITGQNHLKLKNPRSQEQAYLRQSLLPTLLKAVVDNTTYKDNFGVFEIARTYTPRSDEMLPLEHTMLALAWQQDEARLRVKSDIDQIMRLLQITPQFVTSHDNPSLHPARQVTLEVDGVAIGCYGELHSKIMQNQKLRNAVAVVELDVVRLLELWQSARFEPLPRYQSSYRDIAVMVPDKVTWQQLAVSLSQVEDVVVTYQDEFQRESGRVITVHLELQAHAKTLNEQDIQQRLQQIATVVKQDLDAELEL